MGFEEFNEAVLERIVQPLAAIVFPQWTDLLKHHHTFTVKYEPALVWGAGGVGAGVGVGEGNVPFSLCTLFCW